MASPLDFSNAPPEVRDWFCTMIAAQMGPGEAAGPITGTSSTLGSSPPRPPAIPPDLSPPDLSWPDFSSSEVERSAGERALAGVEALNAKFDTYISKRAREEEERDEGCTKKLKLAKLLASLTAAQRISREAIHAEVREQMEQLRAVAAVEAGTEDQTGAGALGGAREHYVLDYTQKAGFSANESLIARASVLVADSHKNQATGLYEHDKQVFTLDDCRFFGKATFGNWKRAHEVENDAAKKQKYEKHKTNNRRAQRTKAAYKFLKSAIPAYEELYSCKVPADVLDAAYLTEYHSELDSSDIPRDEEEGGVGVGVEDEETRERRAAGQAAWEAKVAELKAAHYKRLADAAHMPLNEQRHNEPVWEKKTKAWRSQKFNDILAELSDLALEERAASKGKGKGGPRSTKYRVDLGTKDLRPPAGRKPPYPFQVDPEWEAQYTALTGKALKKAPKNPDGFDSD